MTMAKENKGMRPTGAPSSQGSKSPTILRKPMGSRPKDHAVPVTGKE